MARDKRGGDLSFFGLSIYMGLFCCPRLQSYWESSQRSPLHNITRVMTLFRFQQLKRFIPICDPRADNGASFFFNKLQPLFDHTIETSKLLWLPGTNVSVEKMMVMMHGRSAKTVRTINKHIGAGFKIWAVCEAGYFCFSFPHSNKYPWRYCSEYKGRLPHSSAIVARLCKELPRTRRGFAG